MVTFVIYEHNNDYENVFALDLFKGCWSKSKAAKSTGVLEIYRREYEEISTLDRVIRELNTYNLADVDLVDYNDMYTAKSFRSHY